MCCTVVYRTVHFCALLYCTILYYTILYGTFLCSTVPALAILFNSSIIFLLYFLYHAPLHTTYCLHNPHKLLAYSEQTFIIALAKIFSIPESNIEILNDASGVPYSMSCPTLRCAVLSYPVLRYAVLSYAVLPSPVMCCVMLCCPMLSFLVLCCAVLCCAVLCCPS